MKNNKIIMLLLFSLIYCNGVFGMEEDSPFEETPSWQLIRQPGFWSDEQDLSLFADKKFFYTPTTAEHQREDWYQLTRYVAEPWSTVTNLPLLFVAHTFKDKKPIASAALAFAGTASAVSHAIPKQWLNVVDRIGACAAVAGVA